jgi:hypothetical protein
MSLARHLLHRPQREFSWKAFHSHAIVPLPSEPQVLPGTEPIDILFGPIAQPDHCALEGSHHAGGVVHCAAKHIAFLHMHRPDMNAGTNLDLGMAGIPLKCHRLVQRCVGGFEGYEAIANGLDIPAFELGDQFAALVEISTTDEVHGLILNSSLGTIGTNQLARFHSQSHAQHELLTGG